MFRILNSKIALSWKKSVIVNSTWMTKKTSSQHFGEVQKNTQIRQVQHN